ncbi:MAG TPA: DUF92 domain-containing protein, partial [Woeseiaceae bacterium]|nr:DUF92 domain-containing protein [Woeseiaceae bacterium]
MLTSGRPVPRGTPGAVTVTGTLLTAAAGACAASVYGLAQLAGGTAAGAPLALLFAAAVSGAVFGSLLDSLLGASWQARYVDGSGRLTDVPCDESGTQNSYVGGSRWLNNDMVNLGNSVGGAASGCLVWLAAGIAG